jgi:hypothetical protein
MFFIFFKKNYQKICKLRVGNREVGNQESRVFQSRECGARVISEKGPKF